MPRIEISEIWIFTRELYAVTCFHRDVHRSWPVMTGHAVDKTTRVSKFALAEWRTKRNWRAKVRRSLARTLASTLRFCNLRTRNGDRKYQWWSSVSMQFHIPWNNNATSALLFAVSRRAHRRAHLDVGFVSPGDTLLGIARSQCGNPDEFSFRVLVLSKTLKLRQERSAKGGGEACSVNDISKRGWPCSATREMRTGSVFTSAIRAHGIPPTLDGGSWG